MSERLNYDPDRAHAEAEAVAEAYRLLKAAGVEVALLRVIVSPNPGGAPIGVDYDGAGRACRLFLAPEPQRREFQAMVGAAAAVQAAVAAIHDALPLTEDEAQDLCRAVEAELAQIRRKRGGA